MIQVKEGLCCPARHYSKDWLLFRSYYITGSHLGWMLKNWGSAMSPDNWTWNLLGALMSWWIMIYILHNPFDSWQNYLFLVLVVRSVLVDHQLTLRAEENSYPIDEQNHVVHPQAHRLPNYTSFPTWMESMVRQTAMRVRTALAPPPRTNCCCSFSFSRFEVYMIGILS